MKKPTSFADVVWITLIALVIITAILLLGAWVFMALTWNLGVVGLAAALGLVVSKISFGTAFGAIFVTMTLGQLIHGRVFDSK